MAEALLVQAEELEQIDQQIEIDTQIAMAEEQTAQDEIPQAQVQRTQMRLEDPLDTSDDEEEPAPRFIYIPKPESEDVQQDGLLWKELVTEGQGEWKPEPGMIAKVHYVGTVLGSDRVFEDTRLYGNPLDVVIGGRGVLKSLSYGLVTMKKGEKAVFISYPKYAFARSKRYGIPRMSTIKLEVELIDWVDNLVEASDGQTEKPKIIRERIALPSSELAFPIVGSFLRVSWEGSYKGTVFDTKKSVEFFMGDMDLLNGITIPRGFDIALRAFQPGEKSRLTYESCYAFGEKESAELGIPANSTVTYIIELLNVFNMYDDGRKKTIAASVSVCRELKRAAVQLYDLGKYERAIKKYRGILELLDTKSVAIDPDAERFGEEILRLIFNAYLALGKCLMKTDEMKNAVLNFKTALEIEPNSIDALLILGRAHLLPSINNPQDALNYFSAAMKLEPGNSEVMTEVGACKKTVKDMKAKESAIAARMLGLKN